MAALPDFVGRARARLVVASVAVAALVAVAVVLLVRGGSEPVASGCRDLPAAPRGSTSGQPFIGTLATRPGSAGRESDAGIKMAMVELRWREFEPDRGRFDGAYARRVCSELATFRRAGMQVTLGLGLHFTPAWVLDTPGARMVDHTGARSRQFDLVFSARMRALVASYVREVDRAIGLRHFWAVRITSGGMAELIYPSENYWAFSSGAQNGADRPAGLAANPLPGWRPGEPGPSVARRTAWLQWYLGALSDVADWQMRLARGLGFAGWFQILTPGRGVQPTQVAALVAAGPRPGLLGRGAQWSRVYHDLTERDGVMAYVTSVADGSGRDDVCRSDDPEVGLTSPLTRSWSATRWQALVARVNDFPIAGEVPGYPSDDEGRKRYADRSSTGLLARAGAQLRGCDLVGLYWAHDDQVQDGTVPLSRLAAQAPDGAEPPASRR